MDRKCSEAEDELRLLKYEADFYRTCSEVRQNGVELQQLKSYLLNELLEVEKSKSYKMREYAQNTIGELQISKEKLNQELELIKVELEKFQLTSKSGRDDEETSVPIVSSSTPAMVIQEEVVSDPDSRDMQYDSSHSEVVTEPIRTVNHGSNQRSPCRSRGVESNEPEGVSGSEGTETSNLEQRRSKKSEADLTGHQDSQAKRVDLRPVESQSADSTQLTSSNHTRSSPQHEKEHQSKPKKRGPGRPRNINRTVRKHSAKCETPSKEEVLDDILTKSVQKKGQSARVEKQTVNHEKKKTDPQCSKAVEKTFQRKNSEADGEVSEKKKSEIGSKEQKKGPGRPKKTPVELSDHVITDSDHVIEGSVSDSIVDLSNETLGKGGVPVAGMRKKDKPGHRGKNDAKSQLVNSDNESRDCPTQTELSNNNTNVDSSEKLASKHSTEVQRKKKVGRPKKSSTISQPSVAVSTKVVAKQPISQDLHTDTEPEVNAEGVTNVEPKPVPTETTAVVKRKRGRPRKTDAQKRRMIVPPSTNSDGLSSDQHGEQRENIESSTETRVQESSSPPLLNTEVSIASHSQPISSNGDGGVLDPAEAKSTEQAAGVVDDDTLTGETQTKTESLPTVSPVVINSTEEGKGLPEPSEQMQQLQDGRPEEPQKEPKPRKEKRKPGRPRKINSKSIRALSDPPSSAAAAKTQAMQLTASGQSSPGNDIISESEVVAKGDTDSLEEEGALSRLPPPTQAKPSDRDGVNGEDLSEKLKSSKDFQNDMEQSKSKAHQSEAKVKRKPGRPKQKQSPVSAPVISNEEQSTVTPSDTNSGPPTEQTITSAQHNDNILGSEQAAQADTGSSKEGTSSLSSGNGLPQTTKPSDKGGEDHLEHKDSTEQSESKTHQSEAKVKRKPGRPKRKQSPVSVPVIPNEEHSIVAPSDTNSKQTITSAQHNDKIPELKQAAQENTDYLKGVDTSSSLSGNRLPLTDQAKLSDRDGEGRTSAGDSEQPVSKIHLGEAKVKRKPGRPKRKQSPVSEPVVPNEEQSTAVLSDTNSGPPTEQTATSAQHDDNIPGSEQAAQEDTGSLKEGTSSLSSGNGLPQTTKPFDRGGPNGEDHLEQLKNKDSTEQSKSKAHQSEAKVKRKPGRPKRKQPVSAPVIFNEEQSTVAPSDTNSGPPTEQTITSAQHDDNIPGSEQATQEDTGSSKEEGTSSRSSGNRLPLTDQAKLSDRDGEGHTSAGDSEQPVSKTHQSEAKVKRKPGRPKQKQSPVSAPVVPNEEQSTATLSNTNSGPPTEQTITSAHDNDNILGSEQAAQADTGSSKEGTSSLFGLPHTIKPSDRGGLNGEDHLEQLKNKDSTEQSKSKAHQSEAKVKRKPGRPKRKQSPVSAPVIPNKEHSIVASSDTNSGPPTEQTITSAHDNPGSEQAAQEDTGSSKEEGISSLSSGNGLPPTDQAKLSGRDGEGNTGQSISTGHQNEAKVKRKPGRPKRKQSPVSVPVISNAEIEGQSTAALSDTNSGPPTEQTITSVQHDDNIPGSEQAAQENTGFSKGEDTLLLGDELLEPTQTRPSDRGDVSDEGHTEQSKSTGHQKDKEQSKRKVGKSEAKVKRKPGRPKRKQSPVSAPVISNAETEEQSTAAPSDTNNESPSEQTVPAVEEELTAPATEESDKQRPDDLAKINNEESQASDIVDGDPPPRNVTSKQPPRGNDSKKRRGPGRPRKRKPDDELEENVAPKKSCTYSSDDHLILISESSPADPKERRKPGRPRKRKPGEELVEGVAPKKACAQSSDESHELPQDAEPAQKPRKKPNRKKKGWFFYSHQKKHHEAPHTANMEPDRSPDKPLVESLGVLLEVPEPTEAGNLLTTPAPVDIECVDRMGERSRSPEIPLQNGTDKPVPPTLSPAAAQVGGQPEVCETRQRDEKEQHQAETTDLLRGDSEERSVGGIDPVSPGRLTDELEVGRPSDNSESKLNDESEPMKVSDQSDPKRLESESERLAGPNSRKEHDETSQVGSQEAAQSTSIPQSPLEEAPSKSVAEKPEVTAATGEKEPKTAREEIMEDKGTSQPSLEVLANGVMDERETNDSVDTAVAAAPARPPVSNSGDQNPRSLEVAKSLTSKKNAQRARALKRLPKTIPPAAASGVLIDGATILPPSKRRKTLLALNPTDASVLSLVDTEDLPNRNTSIHINTSNLKTLKLQKKQ